MISAADHTNDLAPRLAEIKAHCLQRTGCDPLLLANQAEEEMLRSDVAVLEPARLVLRQDNDLVGALGKAFEHLRELIPFADGRRQLEKVARSYPWPRGAKRRPASKGRGKS